MQVRFYADSLGLARQELQIKYSERYISILQDHWLKKNGQYPEIIDRARGSLSIKDIAVWFEEDCRYLGNEADIIILQGGIVDCAPRPIPLGLRRIVAKSPAFIRDIVIKFLHNNRALLLKMGFKFQITSTKEFYQEYNQLLKKASAIAKKVYVLNIAPTNADTEARSPGFTQNIEKYNFIINTVIVENNWSNVYLIDVNSLLKSKENFDDFINPLDGHHITKEGNKLYANAILNLEGALQ